MTAQLQNYHQSHHIFGFVQGERAQKLNNHIFVHASIAAVPDQADCEFREDLRKDEVANSNLANSSTIPKSLVIWGFSYY